jgi:HEAT repeat protein
MTRALVLVGWIAASLPLGAQPKLLVNAKLDTRSASAGLESQFRALVGTDPQPAWIGYSVASVKNYVGCEYVRDNPQVAGVVHLEPPDQVVILIRVDEKAVSRVRALSPDCEIDAGGAPVHWLTGVQPAQSVALLVTLAGDRERIGDGALGAIAQHGDPSADQALDRFLAPGQPESVRQRVVSYMGSSRGRHGFEVLKKLVASDPDERIRERAVSALANSRQPEATELLIATARTDQNARLRQQALGALGRKAGPAALDAISKAIESDPDNQVRLRAVSALSTLPDGAGVPTLIQLARSTQNAEIRKRAMSTLGSSRDPRALAFFEDVLKK